MEQEVKNPFPEFVVPDGYTLDSYFEHVAREGFARRWDSLGQLESVGRLKKSRYRYDQRLAREIAIIQQMKFSGYSLIVWDFIRYGEKITFPLVRAVDWPQGRSTLLTRWESPILILYSMSCCLSGS